MQRKFKRTGKYYAYILECQDGTYYTGYTSGLEKRIKLHNSGRGAKYTRDRRPVKLVWCKEYKYFKKAFSEERRIKTLTREKKDKLVSGAKIQNKNAPNFNAYSKISRCSEFKTTGKYPQRFSSSKFGVLRKNSSTFSSQKFGMTPKRKSVFIRTFGCQMNAHDSEIIAGMLMGKGYKMVDSPDKADIVLFNTCSVREHAEARVWGKVMELRKDIPPRFRTQRVRNLSGGDKIPAKKIIGILGCMAQTYKEKIFERLPHVDLVCGTANIYEIPKLLDSLKNREKVLAVDNNQRDTEKKIDISKRENKAKAFVSIMEGCDNYCSYCIVPYARGAEVSRPVSIIIDEIKRLVDDGVKEVMLLGQNVNSYQLPVTSHQLKLKKGFVRLLEKVNNTEGLERIRFMTSHPKDASLELFTAMRDMEKVCEHLHLPVQSGSSRVLKLMNRIYTRDDYLRKIDSLRKLVKDCAVTTDIIVGFPSETEKDFDDTVKLMREVGFDNAFIFKYSARKGTKAALLKDDVEDEIKQQRNQILLKLQEDISRKKNEALIGKTLEVLIEGMNKKSKAEFIGHTGQAKLAVFEKDDKSLGDIVNIKITSCTGHTLKGRIV